MRGFVRGLVGAIALIGCADSAEDIAEDGESTGTASAEGSESKETGTVEPIPIEPAASADAYFLPSYDEARARFIETAAALQTHYDGVVVQSHAIPSATDTDLTIDTVLIPAQTQAEKLLVVTSGVHGVEGFVGSAVQQMFIAELLPAVDVQTMTVLFVHAVNPWGYRHHRRVSENNVDLNRNFSVDRGLFDIVNAPYAEIDDFLNPTEEVTDDTVSGALTDVITFALSQDRQELQQAILQGQYAFPDGLYFGGMDFEPQQPVMLSMLSDLVAQHEAVFLMDVHSGYGERGRLHLFGAPGVGTPEAMDAVFEGYDIDTGESDENFYETTGDFILFVGEIAANAGKTYVGMTIEYGTMDSQTDIGAARSLVNVKLENQAFHHGYATDTAQKDVETAFLAGYNPPEADYRGTIIDGTRQMLPVFVDRFVALP